MSLVKVIEVVASSKKSWEDAVQQAVAEASKSLRHIRGVDVVKHTAHVEHEVMAILDAGRPALDVGRPALNAWRPS
jgi:flavin-binding protein dodecin